MESQRCRFPLEGQSYKAISEDSRFPVCFQEGAPNWQLYYDGTGKEKTLYIVEIFVSWHL